MFSQEKINTALKMYYQCGSVTKTIRTLGYPARRTMYLWIENEEKEKFPRKELNITNTAEHPRNPSVDIKMDAIHRCFELGESVKSVSEDIGYSRASIYQWHKRYLRGGAIALMNNKNISPGQLKKGMETPSSDQDIRQLQEQVNDLQMEIDILKETINVLKKDPGVDQTALRNREKAVIVDALKDKYSLPDLLKMLDFPKSSYYYQQAAMRRKDKHKEIRGKITKLFYENRECYGYRRIHSLLKRDGVIISEKIIRRIMKEEGLIVRSTTKKKYNSYKGEISPSVPNVIQRDFHAEKPNCKWLTDITEFAIPAGKVYLSPIVDCFDGMLPSWTIGSSPDAALVNKMLDKAVEQLNENDHPIIHSDRGCHYRWPGWIERMNNAGLERSMSKKGCSPDNSACEGLFGRIKNEMFYSRDWGDTSVQQFIEILDELLIWYNDKRIKESLGYMSPREYRQSLGLVA